MRTALLLTLLVHAAIAAGNEEVVVIPARDGVTQPYLLSAPPAGKALAIAILFPGGAGKTDLARESARSTLDRGNFLVRSRRLFAAQGIATAVVDAPSDRSAGMDDFFRLSSTHADDIAKVVSDLRARLPGLPVYLIGTSRGTVSAAAVGRQLGKAVDGVVLTATLFEATRKQPGLSGFDFATIPAPLLFVHHTDDACAYTPHTGARRLAGRYPLISVSGGLPPQSDPCEAMSAHGFLGRETESVAAMANWMLKQPFPREIK